jgi:tetratricopeptide (TPR) repeat protein
MVPNTPSQVWADMARGCFNCFRGGFAGELEVMAIGVSLCHRALEMARSFEDEQALYWASFWWLTFAKAPHHFGERLELAGELIKVGFSAKMVKGRFAGQTVALDVLIEWGMRDKAEEGLQRMKSMAYHSGLSRLHIRTLDAFFTTLDGRLEEAVQISSEIRDQGRGLGVSEYGAVLAGLCGVTPRLLLGDYEEAFNIAAAHKESLFAYAGDVAEARKALQKWVIDRPDFGTDKDEIGATKDVCLLEEAVMVGHKEAAELLMKRLHVVANHAVAVNRLTSIGRHLGAAAAMLGRPDEALSYYGQAMEVATKLRFRPEIALIRLQLAELLLDHYPDEKSAAVEYLDFAIGEFRDMQMQPSLERATRLRELMG